MKRRLFDYCIGCFVKAWITMIWLLILLSGNKALGQDLPQPKTDHIKTPTCLVKYSKDFNNFELHYTVTYSDGKEPYQLTAETGTHDYEALYDQCAAFLKAMTVAHIDELVAEGKAHMAKMKDEHTFLRIPQKVAKKEAP